MNIFDKNISRVSLMILLSLALVACENKGGPAPPGPPKPPVEVDVGGDGPASNYIEVVNNTSAQSITNIVATPVPVSYDLQVQTNTCSGETIAPGAKCRITYQNIASSPAAVSTGNINVNYSLGGVAQSQVAVPYTLSSYVDVGGAFTAAGATSAVGGVAANNSTAWSALGVGVVGTINAMAVDSVGRLYVGGNFILSTSSGTATNIAMWDGYSWHAMSGLPAGDVVTSLAVNSNSLLATNNTLYVGGSNGSTGFLESWSPLFSAFTPVATFNGAVNALAYDYNGFSESLFVGGAFTQVTPEGQSLPDLDGDLVQYQAGSWSQLTSGGSNITFSNGSIASLLYVPDFSSLHSNDRIYIGSSAPMTAAVIGSSPVTLNNVAYYKLGLLSNSINALGTAGSTTNGVNAAVNAFAYDANGNVYFTGAFTQLGTTGSGTATLRLAYANVSTDTTITQFSGGINGTGYGLAVDGLGFGDVYVVGNFSQVGASVPAANYAINHAGTWKASTAYGGVLSGGIANAIVPEVNYLCFGSSC